MTLAPPGQPGQVRITNDDLPGEEAYAALDAYRGYFYALGWRSVDDPLYDGSDSTLPVYPQLVVDLQVAGFDQSRWFGRKTTSGAPSTGTWEVGDWISDSAGAVWVCTVAGTPGTWVNPTGGGGGTVSDTAYAGSWDGVTTVAPSKNAVYDQMELRAPKASPTFTGTVVVPDATTATGAMNRQTSDARYVGLVAAPTGVAATDTATITAALAAVPAAGGRVLLAAGTYLVNGNLLPAAKTTLQGQGKHATTIKLDDAKNVNVVNVSGDDVTICDLSIDGNRANQSGNSNGIYSVSARTRVHHCHVKNANGYNIVGFPGATDMVVEDCLSETPRDECIEYQGARGLIARNHCKSAGKNGIYVWSNVVGYPGNVCHDVAVVDNIVEGAAALSASYAAIRVDDGAYNITVTGNVITAGGTTSPGIAIGTSTAQRVFNVTVADNTVSAATSNAITVYASDFVTVRGNTVRANTAGSGIYCQSTAAQVSVTGNVVTAAAQYGIEIRCPRAVVADNVCSGNGLAGILVSSATSFELIGNTCNLNTQRGIEVSAGTGGTVAANTCASNGASYDGITIYGASAGLAVNANHCVANGRAGIRVEDSSNVTLTGNVCRNNCQGGGFFYPGIYIDVASGAVANVTVTGNRCYDDQGTKTQGHGLKLVGACDTVVLGSNLFTGNASGVESIDSAVTNLTRNVVIDGEVSPSNDDLLQRKAGAWINRTPAQVKTDLALVKGDVGLGSVDNTADTAKPVSTAQQAALDLKAPLASPTLTGTPAAPTAAQGTNTTQIATTAYVQTEAGLLIPKSLVDAKGDILVGSADNAVARLAVGTDTHVLTADSTATNGVKWAAQTGGGAPTTASYVTISAEAGLSAETTFATALGAWRKIARKTADETVTSSTTLQDDDHLLFAMLANEVWLFEFVVNAVTASSNTPDIKFAIGVPALATVEFELWGAQTGDTTGGQITGSRQRGTSTGTALAAGLVTADVENQFLKGRVVNGANAGNAVLQWAQNASDASGVTVKAGSRVLALRES